MARIATNTTAMSSTAIQAPRVNFVSSTIASTTAVVAKPKALIARERAIEERTRRSTCVRISRVQCRHHAELTEGEAHEDPTM